VLRQHIQFVRNRILEGGDGGMVGLVGLPRAKPD